MLTSRFYLYEEYTWNLITGSRMERQTAGGVCWTTMSCRTERSLSAMNEYTYSHGSWVSHATLKQGTVLGFWIKKHVHWNPDGLSLFWKQISFYWLSTGTIHCFKLNSDLSKANYTVQSILYFSLQLITISVSE